MTCPTCGDSRNQMLIGKLGNREIIRCGACGMQYHGNTVVSRSEWGSYTYDGETDMKVLRKRAEGAVKYFNNGRPRTEMNTNVFGYPFSIIDNGKLSDIENAYKGNVIIRCLSEGGGVYKGKVILSYDDDYNDGRGQGGAGSVLIGDVKDVRIENGYLVISGLSQNKPKTYRYLIQDRPDDKKIVFPIPKGGKVPTEPAKPKKSTLDGWKDPPKPKRELTVREMIDGSLADFSVLLERLEKEIDRAGHWYVYPYNGRRLPMYSAKEIEDGLGDPMRGTEIVDAFRDCYLSHYSEYWTGWSGFGITYLEYKDVQKRLREISRGCIRPKKEKPKPEPKPEPKKAVPKTAPKPAPKPEPKKSQPKKPILKPKRKKGELVYEVRVEGKVEGSFSSKAKAESLKRQLKAGGKKAKIVGVFC